MDKHWTEKMFLEHGDLFFKFLKRGDEVAVQQVEILEKTFSEMDVHPGGRILDVCCGYGRHALRLAEKGFIVTGIDLSPVVIEHANKLAKNMKIEDRVKFLVGDARKVFELLEEDQGSFNAIINMWTSIGYYDDETDKNILRQLNQLAASDCILVLDLANRDYLIKHFQRFGITDMGNCELHEYRKLDLKRSHFDVIWKFYNKSGEKLNHITTIPLSYRLYSLHEVINLIEKTGWQYVNSYGTLDLKPLTQDTFRMMIVGKNRE